MSAYARLKRNATPTLITDRGARPEEHYAPYPKLYSGAAVSVLIGTVHPVFVPADVRLFRAVHLCSWHGAVCLFRTGAFFEVLFWENLKKPLKNGRSKINKFVNLFPFWNFLRRFLIEKSTQMRPKATNTTVIYRHISFYTPHPRAQRVAPTCTVFQRSGSNLRSHTSIFSRLFLVISNFNSIIFFSVTKKNRACARCL